jgi:glycosyltransferase involved in cell wall biosynthesis
LREYDVAHTIAVTSSYAYATFVEHGVDEAKLRLQTLNPDSRFRPLDWAPRDDGVFHVVYVGALSVVKGVPVLLDAFSRIDYPRAKLTLVGGWGTRGMRRYIEHALHRDPRVRIAPGDPLPHLLSADVYVHPSYQDGLGLAALEALACCVPVIVTEDTGMKERVREGVNGSVVPTGDVQALTLALRTMLVRIRSEALSGSVG